ncbi:septation protein SepH, partial [Nocardioides sp.]|uniref:septation protein SepH n=1 Tax=Nocardioides sp. TaxID=35761 RepID=UPI003569C877
MDTHLRLRGLTADGTRLQLVDPSGLEFTVEIDARLRAALHGDPARGPQNDRQPTQTTPTRGGTVEKTMENILRPREIQARIRAGETPEAIANAAHTTLDKVMPYAAPVLAEREHVAQRALRASVRRAGGEASSAARTLGEAVSTRLRSMNVDPDSVLWDAWRREDGRWSLTANFNAAEVEGLAELTFDQRGNFVILDNDQARWLVG